MSRAKLSVGLLFLAVAACGGGNKIANTAQGIAAGPQPVDFLPGGSSIVMGIDFEKGLKAKIAQSHLDKLRAETPKSVADLKAQCGIDLFGGDVKNVTVGMEDPNKQETVFLVSDNKFEQKTFDECIAKMGATVAQRGKLVDYKQAKREYVGYWPNSTTSVFSFDGKADFTGVMNGGLNQEMLGLKAKTNTDSIFWVMGKIPPEAAGNIPGATHFRLSIDGDDTVTFSAAVVFDTQENASTSKAKLDQQMGLSSMVLGEAAKNIVVGQSGNDVTIDATFTEAEIENIIKTVMTMAGK